MTNEDDIKRTVHMPPLRPANSEVRITNLPLRKRSPERTDDENKAHRALNNEAHGATLELIEDLERIKAEFDSEVMIPGEALEKIAVVEALHKATMAEIEFRRLHIMGEDQ